MNKILSVKKSKKMNFSKDEVWDVITTPNYLNETHPFCKVNNAISWPGVGSKDTLEYLSGLTFEREFTHWDENGYDLIIGTANGRKSKVRWRLSGNDQESELSIQINTYSLKNFPGPLYVIPFVFQVHPQLSKYLDSVLGGIEYFLINKNPVPRNHFGTHKWFSEIK